MCGRSNRNQGKWEEQTYILVGQNYVEIKIHHRMHQWHAEKYGKFFTLKMLDNQ